MVPSSSTYSFRSICPSTFNTAGQYPSQELLAPAVILTSSESPSNSTWNKLKKFAGKVKPFQTRPIEPADMQCRLARTSSPSRLRMPISFSPLVQLVHSRDLPIPYHTIHSAALSTILARLPCHLLVAVLDKHSVQQQ